MIKKILTLAVFIGLSTFLVGQTCAPDTSIKEPGYYPRTLDTAEEMSMYSMTVQIHSTRDTMVDNPFGGGQISATIDSIIVDSVAGFPAGVTYMCTPSNCRFVSLKTHCINIYGTPMQGSADSYPLVIYVTVKATLSGGFKTSVTEQIRDFTMHVKDDNISSSAQVKELEGFRVYPNPSNGTMHIDNRTDKNGTIQVFNAEGKHIEQRTIKGNEKIQMNNSNWVTGIYTIRIIFTDGSMSHTQVSKQ